MSKLCVVVGLAAGLAATSAASADLFSAVDSYATYDRWFGDYPGTTINWTNGGLPSLRVQESGYIPGTGWSTRNVAFLAVGGVPLQFDPNQGFRFDVDVTINSNNLATEAGIMVGTAPNLPNSALANTGDFHIRIPDGEIAAFGGVNPFFANNNPFNGGNTHPWPAIAAGNTYRMTLIYGTSAFGSTMNFGVNGVFTGDLAMGGPLLAGSYVGVFAQGPNNNVDVVGILQHQKDVVFTNASITVPAPASAALLGLGGLALRRRRR